MKNQEYENIQIPSQLSEAVQKGIREGKRIRKKRRKNILTGMGSVAAIFVLFFAYCFENPTFASELPLIGEIFSKVEKKGSFPGDYSEKATNLVKEQDTSEEGTPFVKEQERELYSGDTEKGITMIPTEVYCDGSSLYLSMEWKNSQENGFGETYLYAKEHGTISEEQYPWDYDSMQIAGNWEGGTQKGTFSVEFVGKLIDPHTYIGKVKIPLEHILEQDSDFQLQITFITWEDLSGTASAYATYASNSGYVVMEGEWELKIPVAIDKTQTKRMMVDEENVYGLGIQEVFVSPYEIRVVQKIPEFDSETLEEIYTSHREKCKEVLGAEAEIILGEAGLNSQDTQWYGDFAVFNEKGERMETGSGGTEGESIYQREMKSAEKLYFYLFPDAVEADKWKNQETARECCVFFYELDLNI